MPTIPSVASKASKFTARYAITFVHELTIRGTAEEIRSALEQNEKSEKGEYCLVCDLRGVTLPEKPAAVQASLEARLLEEMLSGTPVRDAMKALIDGGEKKNAVYAASLRVKAFLDEEKA